VRLRKVNHKVNQINKTTNKRNNLAKLEHCNIDNFFFIFKKTVCTVLFQDILLSSTHLLAISYLQDDAVYCFESAITYLQPMRGWISARIMYKYLAH